jgi:hypothetical protein
VVEFSRIFCTREGRVVERTTPRMTISQIFQDVTIPWAIDMDGTLIREDVTELAFVKCIKTPWLWHIFLYGLILQIFISVHHAHRYWEIRLPPDINKLTFHENLIQRIEDHCQRGGNAVLATASHYRVAKEVARRVPILKDIIGSVPPTVMNAAGAVKAKILSNRYPNGYIYAGNSQDDLEVWKDPCCKAMMLVNCKPEVLTMAKQNSKPYVVIP